MSPLAVPNDESALFFSRTPIRQDSRHLIDPALPIRFKIKAKNGNAFIDETGAPTASVALLLASIVCALVSSHTEHVIRVARFLNAIQF